MKSTGWAAWSIFFIYCLFSSVVGQESWTLRNPLPTNELLNKITYGNGKYIIVGNNGTILTSTNGTVWTRQVSNTNVNLFGAICDGNQIVVVGDSGTICTSPDGISWTKRVSGTSRKLACVGWGQSSFVAAGTQGTILTSADGIAWNIRDIHDTASNFTSIAWNGKIFVLGSPLYTSPDGINWTQRSVYAGNNIVWGKNIFVASGVKWVSSMPQTMISTSPDGIVWTDHVFQQQDELLSVAWGNDTYIAVSSTGSVYLSSNGTDWTIQHLEGGNVYRGVAWGNNQFVTFGTSARDATTNIGFDSFIFSSSDGSNWAVQAPTGPTMNFSGIAWGSDKFVAVGTNAIYSSPDAINWTNRSPMASDDIKSVVWGNNRFIAIGYDKGLVFSSPDGINWSSQTSGTPGLRSIAWGNNRFIILGSSIYSSADGVSWINQTPNEYNYLQTAVWGKNQWVGAGYSGRIRTSADGSVWTSRTSGTARDLYSVAASIDKFVAVGDSGTILSSADGITWTEQTSGTEERLTSVTWNAGQFVVVGTLPYAYMSSKIIFMLTSSDGFAWTKWSTGTSSGLYGVNFGNNQYVAVGDHGTILASPSSSKTRQCNYQPSSHLGFSFSKSSIRFTLIKQTLVSIKLFNIQGRLVQTLLNCTLAPGEHSVKIPAKLGHSSYLFSLTVGDVQFDKAVIAAR